MMDALIMLSCVVNVDSNNSNLITSDTSFFMHRYLTKKFPKGCEKSSIDSNFLALLSGDGLEKLLCVQCCSNTAVICSSNFFSVKHACKTQGKFLLFYMHSQSLGICNV